MNYFLAFFILVFSLNLGQAQSPIFFNEVGVSLLRSTVADVNTIDKFGFGVNLYKIPKGDKISQVVFGMELNQYNQLKKTVTRRSSYLKNVTYSATYVSIPVGLRINLGENRRSFLQLGGSFDIVARGHQKGTGIFYSQPSGIDTIDVDQSAQFANPSYGARLGFGHVISENRDILIRTDFHLSFLSSGAYSSTIYTRYVGLMIGIKISK